MVSPPYPQRFDPELDADRDPDSRVVAQIARNHTRLIANPFLAMLGWILFGTWLKIGLKMRSPMLSFAAFLGMPASLLLIQYHCLDCGKTGSVFRARRHLCPPAAARASTSGNGGWRTRGPSISAQLKIWFAIVIMTAFFYLLNTASRR